jgi:arsenical pump membrane protein
MTSSVHDPRPPGGEHADGGRAGIRSLATTWGLAVVGVVAAVASVASDHAAARSAAGQVWSPFVLVAGLLLVGSVADQDGIFAAAGHKLAKAAPNGALLFAGAALGVAVVTAVLNLDTSVVFLTPVLVYAARSRGQDGVALLAACLLLSNAGSLLLPGSNLTNLIVLGHLHLSGAQFLGHMALPWVASVLVTAVVVALVEHRSLPLGPGTPEPPAPMVVGLGALGVAAVVVLVLVLRAPALPVAGVGVVVVAVRLLTGRQELARVRAVLGVPVLVGLFGIAVALGTLGRSWSGPATLLAHLDAVGVAVVAAAATVAVNNLPAAALLAARVPPHPFALLVGLDVGPNLFVTGSLAWVLWWRTVRSTGAVPPIRRAVVLGLITVPLSMAAALAMLAATGST